MNEAETVNAQRDAQRAREMDTILDTSVRLGAYLRRGANTADAGAAEHPVRSLHEMGRGKSADRPEYPVDLPDCFRVLEGYRERIAALEALVDRLLRNLDSLQTAHDAWQRIAKAGR